MPAAVDNPLTLPRLTDPSADASVLGPVELVVSAQEQTDGAGARISRPFPGELPLEDHQAGRLAAVPDDPLAPRNLVYTPGRLSC